VSRANIIDAYDFIAFFEGERFTAYQDTAGIWTIGVGHTRGVKQGDKITREKSRQYFAQDFDNAIKQVESNIRVPCTPSECLALASQAFNMTSKSFIKLAEYFNHDKDLWREKTLLYCHDVKGNKLKGLYIRRIAEYLLSLGKPWKAECMKMQKIPVPEITQYFNMLTAL